MYPATIWAGFTVMKSQAAKRPRTPRLGQRKRIAVGLRVTPETYKELAARAEKNGTSMTAVIEYLLRQSMIFEDFAKHEIMNVLHDFNSEGSKEAAYQAIPGAGRSRCGPAAASAGSGLGERRVRAKRSPSYAEG
jgi:hypothetical protein